MTHFIGFGYSRERAALVEDVSSCCNSIDLARVQARGARTTLYRRSADLAETSYLLRCLRRFLRNPDQRSQNPRGAFQPRGGCVPFVEEHHLHVRAHAGAFGMLADIGDEAFGIGESVVAEGEHRAFRADLDPLDIGVPA